MVSPEHSVYNFQILKVLLKGPSSHTVNISFVSKMVSACTSRYHGSKIKKNISNSKTAEV